jgi:hypothetical protein
MPHITFSHTSFAGLTVWKTDDGRYQANLQRERGGAWHVCHGVTADEAVAAVLDPAPVALPPPPY